jgi:hypothetical protein
MVRVEVTQNDVDILSEDAVVLVPLWELMYDLLYQKPQFWLPRETSVVLCSASSTVLILDAEV